MPRANILYVYLLILNVSESSNLLQQMYITRAEVNHLFTSNISGEEQSARLKLKALLETPSITPQNNVIVYPQKHVKLSSSSPQKPVLPEPKKSHISQ